MKEIPLSQGQVALVDDEDFERLSQFTWLARRNEKGDCLRVFRRAKGVKVSEGRWWRRKISMTTDILECPHGFRVDHINHNPLDNRRDNLRLCTPKQNWLNRCHRRGCRFPWKGIFENKLLGGYTARIMVDGRRRAVGTFATPEEAALAYNNAAIEHYGEFACLNKLESEGC